MPRAAPPTPTRRSARLNPGGGPVLRNRHVEQPPSPRPPKRRKSVNISASCSARTTKTDAVKPTTSKTRVVLSTSQQLDRREKALSKKEEQCLKEEEELNERSSELEKKELEASRMISQFQEREALRQLEEHFTCPLCYEIMANPYSLNPPACGHTFCSLCILKWFFSRLHKACGGWHESVDCPICRSLLVITPDRPGRLDLTFPFVHNRLAAKVCESLVERLTQRGVKREESEERSDDRRVIESGSRVKRGKQDKVKSYPDQDCSALDDWKIGGTLWEEWHKKDVEGKRRMNHLLENWTNMTAPEFIEMKNSLGV